MFYVYILKSKKDGLLYTGSTNNLKKRFLEHNAGKVTSSKSRIPFELIYYEAYKAESDASNIIKVIKVIIKGWLPFKRIEK